MRNSPVRHAMAFLALLLIGGVIDSREARAAVVVAVTENREGVEFKASGTVDVSGFRSTWTAVHEGVEVWPQRGNLLFDYSSAVARGFAFDGGPAPIYGTDLRASGFRELLIFWDPSEAFGIRNSLIYSPGEGYVLTDLFSVWIPGNADYTRPVPVQMRMVFVGATIRGLGMTPGTYVTTLPNDTITLDIRPVPLPASAALLMTALFACAAAARLIGAGRSSHRA